jgi:thiosulfate/3-mercaptopyruvate sulfurtransferase
MKKWLQTLCVAFMLTSTAAFAAEAITIQPEEAIKLIGKPGYVFVCGDSETAYENGHIKGSREMYAHHLHHADIMGNLHCEPLYQCPEHAEHYIRSKGIKNGDVIIAYDNWRGPNATGVYSFFKSFGHDKVYVLDGGQDGIKALDPNQKKYDALKAKARKLKKEARKAKKAGNKAKAQELKAQAKQIKGQMKQLEAKLLVQRGKEPHWEHTHYTIEKTRPELLATTEEVVKAMEDIRKNGDKSRYVIIDTRGMTEIIGERKMDNVARGGHIPGSKFIEWKKVTDFKRKKSFHQPEELRKMFESYGVTPDKTIYAYCQVGAGRGSEIITALELLGYKNVKVYSGAWDTWGNNMNLPIHR